MTPEYGKLIKPRMLVCGGRNYQNQEVVFNTLDRICLERKWYYGDPPNDNWLPDVHVIAGGARGADTLAIDWAILNWCSFTEYPADWKTHKKAAGIIRNKQMLEEGKPDLVVGFPGGSGTAHMLLLAQSAGIEVYRWNYKEENK